ncbi:TetR/AcrR family transcriptional regulator [Spirillospora sp. NPDC052242]
MTTQRKPRGPYRKGVRRREQILDTALEVFARRSDAPLQEIADRVGLSQAGVLHYFGSREELLLAVLRRRDTLDLAEAREDSTAPGEAVARTVRHNMDQPGLVRLFVALSSAATDPAHPAHEFFADRYRDLTATIARGLGSGQRTGAVRDDEDAEHMARLLVAVSDGLQLQWLLDPSVDMAALVETFDRLCATPPDD